MSLVRHLNGEDALFLLATGLLLVAVVAYRSNRQRLATPVATVGWIVLSGFWGVYFLGYFENPAAFIHALVVLTTTLVGAYVATLTVRNREPAAALTTGFAVMGLVFAPYEFIAPVYATALDFTAQATAWGLTAIGFTPILERGPNGHKTVLRFANTGVGERRIRIVSACTGISGISLFVGLVAATDTSLRRRLRIAVGLAGLIYLLNVVRTVFVAGALGGAWFTAGGPIVTALFDVSGPSTVSYYVAEHFVSQILVILVLVVVYVRTTTRLPELQEMLSAFLGVIRSDAYTLHERLRSTRS